MYCKGFRNYKVWLVVFNNSSGGKRKKKDNHSKVWKLMNAQMQLPCADYSCVIKCISLTSVAFWHKITFENTVHSDYLYSSLVLIFNVG